VSAIRYAQYKSHLTEKNIPKYGILTNILEDGHEKGLSTLALKMQYQEQESLEGGFFGGVQWKEEVVF